MISSNQWFFAYEGEQAGPVDVQTLAGMIQSGRLPIDVLVYREGMEDWLPANELDLIEDIQSGNDVSPAVSVNNPSKKIFYACGAALLFALLSCIVEWTILKRTHEMELRNLAGKYEARIDNSKKGDHNSLSNPDQHAKDLETLQLENSHLKELNNKLVEKEKKHLITLAKLNNAESDLISQNQSLLKQIQEATNRLAQTTQSGSDLDENISKANKRAVQAEEVAQALRTQLDDTIQKSQAQAIELQKQINRKNEAEAKRIIALEKEKAGLLADIITIRAQLTKATNQIVSLKEELGESPIRVGTPKGPKPPVNAVHFAEIGSTDTKFNFAVINKGSVDGVNVGDTFRVVSKKSNENIALLKITRVQAKVAVGSPGTLDINLLKPGDLIFRE